MDGQWFAIATGSRAFDNSSRTAGRRGFAAPPSQVINQVFSFKPPARAAFLLSGNQANGLCEIRSWDRVPTMNTQEAIKERVTAAPFRPFSVRLPDGRSYHVPGPDYASLSPNGRLLTVYTDGSNRGQNPGCRSHHGNRNQDARVISPVPIVAARKAAREPGA